MQVDLADSTDLRPTDVLGHLADVGCNLHRDETWVMTECHGSGTGVVRLADDRDFVPRDALHARDGSDGDTFGFKDGTLLNVELDERMWWRPRTRRGAAVTDRLEFLAEDGSIDGDNVEGFLERHVTDVDQASQHVWGEPGALLVGEEADSNRPLWCHSSFEQGLHNLEPGQYSEISVVAPTCSDCVDMAASHNGSHISGAGHDRNDIPDAVHGYFHPQIVHPRRYEISCEAVFGGQRETCAAVGSLDRADASELGETPE